MKCQREDKNPLKVALLCFAAAISLMCGNVVNSASFASPTTRLSTAGDKFNGTDQIAIAFEISSRSVLRSRHIELAIGSISASSNNEAFVSIGPVWRTPYSTNRFFAEFGFAPTLISGSRYNGRELGGRFHFTSSASIGKRIGRNSAIALRIQHTSNGGLDKTNPGIDMIGIEFSNRFSE